MRALSNRQATNCETAKNKVCRCRCGGLLHGAMRHLIEEGRAKKEFFETLPQDDPHHVRSDEEKKRRRRKSGLLEAQGQKRLFPLGELS